MVLEGAAEAQTLRRLAEAGVLSPEAFRRACELAHLAPRRDALARRYAVLIGTAHWATGALLLAAFVTGRAAQAVLFGAGFAVAAALSLRGRRRGLASLAALALAGPFLHAAFGLGGWPLFLVWAALTLPFARRSPALAIGWLSLIDAALWGAVPELGWRLAGLGLVHGAAWAGFELHAPGRRGLARLCAALCFAPLAGASWLSLLWRVPAGANEALALLFIGAVGAGLAHRRRFDPILLGIAAAAGMAALTARIASGLLQPVSPSENNLYLALGLLLEAAAVGAWLMRAARARPA